MIVTTTDHIEGCPIKEYRGTVVCQSYIVHAGMIAQARLDVNSARGVSAIQKQAAEVGANAVVGFRITTSESKQGETFMICYGTAVVI